MRKPMVSTLAALTFAALLVPSAAAGQGMSSGWSPQIFFGFSIARLKLDNPGNLTNDGRTGLSAGVSVGFPITAPESIFGLRVEGFVSQRGATIADSVIQQKIKLTYVDVAGLVEFRIPARINGDRITLLAGPVINITTSAQAVVTGQGQTQSVDLSEVTENYDYGYMVGAEFTAIRRYLVMQVAWMPGFKKIFSSTTNNARNQTLMIMFAPRFGR